LDDCKALIEKALDSYLPPEDRYPHIIFRAMRYSVLNGGKRLRPILVLTACQSVGGDISLAIPLACAVEFVHSFSLIHDDLPALDDDDFRRGKPASHKVFGEAVAILAGDALLSLAFETIARTKGVPADAVLEVCRRIAAASGAEGMVTGQVVDIESEGKKIPPETLEFMHTHKTGALIEASVVCGGLIGGANQEQLCSLSHYGKKFGLAFQITDDILDIEGDEAKTGKPVGSDLRKQKSTYPALFGLEASREMAKRAVDEAIESISGFGPEADLLRVLAHLVVDRST